MAPKVTDAYKEQKKKELLESAMACFAEKGYQTATIDDIVAHSGMSKGAVYNYFKSKEDIYLTLLEDITAQSFKRLQDRLKGLKTAEEKLSQFLQFNSSVSYKDVTTRKWTSVQLEFLINASRHPELKERMKERFHLFRSLLANIIKEGQEKGEFRPDTSAEVIADSFWAFQDGVFHHLLVIEDDYPFQAIHALFEKLVLSELRF